MIHDLHLPACRKGPSDNLRTFFPFQPPPVLEREEQIMDAGTINDETRAASAEVSLTT
jgi:hypothetical protein